jgi:PAT family beta-lactamase induction signal transducer AmpG
MAAPSLCSPAVVPGPSAPDSSGSSPDEAASSAPSAARVRHSPHLWVPSTYFAEGYPYTIVNNLCEMLFNRLGASVQVIGLTSLFHLPWNLKFLWAPLADVYETKRRWLLGTEVILAVVLLVLAAWVDFRGSIGVVAVLFGLLAVMAATHDIAIDGYYLETLDERDRSRFVGYRAMAYKVSNALVRGPAVVMVGVVGWAAGLGVLALVMALLVALHAFALPAPEDRRRPLADLLRATFGVRAIALVAALVALVLAEGQLGVVRGLARSVAAAVARVPVLDSITTLGWIALGLLALLGVVFVLRRPLQRRLRGKDSSYTAAFVTFMAQPKVGRMLAFVMLFRTGESFLQKMKVPFLQNTLGLSDVEYGLANGTIGLAASFGATLIGGWLIARHGLRRWIWPFVLMQNVLNLLYVALAVAAENGRPDFWLLTAVIAADHVGEGLGTAALLVYIMRCCDPRHKAAHMAILTALMSVGFTLAGVSSGFLAAALGFPRYFFFSFVATLPMMALLFTVPRLDEPAAVEAPR